VLQGISRRDISKDYQTEELLMEEAKPGMIKPMKAKTSLKMTSQMILQSTMAPLIRPSHIPPVITRITGDLTVTTITVILLTQTTGVTMV